jgi:hypothetical protein
LNEIQNQIISGMINNVSILESLFPFISKKVHIKSFIIMFIQEYIFVVHILSYVQNSIHHTSDNFRVHIRHMTLEVVHLSSLGVGAPGVVSRESKNSCSNTCKNETFTSYY